MAASWNVIWDPLNSNECALLNYTRTSIKLCKRSVIRFNMARFLSKMEELNVPISYTEGLKEIRLTTLPNVSGNYLNGVMQITFGTESTNQIDTVFVHELAHHVDEKHEISSMEKIIFEKKKCAKFMTDKYAKHDVEEYVAVGFEVFYCGTNEERSRMRKMNKLLYKTIDLIHKKCVES